ncbi:putative ankyrin repeat domain-containing protein 19 [Eulemur rufifrons]|uniref:putative ankyrin repeat domain-containing protein 19 n=1 Tax=Eulemur rufifrons TaxID=859984 RepID=UPI003742FA99
MPETGCTVCASSGYVVQRKELAVFHEAVFLGELEIVQEIASYPCSSCSRELLNETDKKHRTALHLACAKGNAQMVTFLLGRNCDLNPCDRKNRTPLIKAVQCQAQECVILLLEHGADPNVVDDYGNTALHYAAYNGDSSIAAKLCAHGATLETINKIVRFVFAVLQAHLTPLLLSLRKGNVEVAEFLIKEKADVNVTDALKRTPLMLAIQCESSSTVSLLLQQSADVFAKDYQGRTAEDYAVAIQSYT